MTMIHVSFVGLLLRPLRSPWRNVQPMGRLKVVRVRRPTFTNSLTLS